MNRAWRAFLERGAAAGRAARALAPEDSELVAQALAQFVDHGVPLAPTTFTGADASFNAAIFPGLGTANAHTGGMIGSGELAGRYVHPAYFDHAPRMHPGGMIDWAAGERPVIGLTGERMLNRQETAVYNRGGGRGASHSVSFGDTNIVINGNADDKAIAQIKRELAGHRTAIAQQQKAI